MKSCGKCKHSTKKEARIAGFLKCKIAEKLAHGTCLPKSVSVVSWDMLPVDLGCSFFESRTTSIALRQQKTLQAQRIA